MKNLSSNR